MPPKSAAPDTPSPAKKRKIETTPVKKGVDFFFKKLERLSQSPKLNGGGGFDRDGEDWEVQRRKQEDEDERLARELQDREGRQEAEDAELAKKLAKDYDQVEATNGEGNKTVTEVEDIYGGGTPQKDVGWLFKSNSIRKETPETPTKSLTLENPSTTSLEEIYAIPLDKDPLVFDPAIDAPCAASWSPGRTPYAFLTHAFILINSTRSRIKIQDYLVNCLRVVIYHDPSSLLQLVWLTTNAIAPPFEGIELNLGGSVISKALNGASGLSPAALKGLYDKYGDIGDVAFEAKMAVRTLVAPTPLTVKGVYSTLRNIARQKGTGSAETKRRLVERLLVSAKGEEVRYIGRTLVQHVTPIGMALM
jgi:DNA ligase 1